MIMMPHCKSGLGFERFLNLRERSSYRNAGVVCLPQIEFCVYAWLLILVYTLLLILLYAWGLILVYARGLILVYE
jgi:hypothetical protein